MKKTLCMCMFCIAGALCLSACDDSSASDTSDVEGKSCDSKTFQTTCAREEVLYCSKTGITKLSKCNPYSETEICVEFYSASKIECDENDEDCQSENSNQTISCIEKSEQCDSEGETKSICETSLSGSTSVNEYKCEKTKDGRLFYHKTGSSKCYDGYGVCADNTCYEPIPCSPNGKHCEGDTLVTCSSGRLRKADCSAYSDPRICTTIDETPRCMDKDDLCQKEGEEIVTKCNANTNKELIDICTRAENGKLYYISGTSRACSNGCNEDNSACAQETCTELGSTVSKCRIQGTATAYTDTYTCVEDAQGKKILKLTSTEKCDDGSGTCSETGECIPAETCEKKSFTSRCEGNVALTCALKKVKRYYCDLYSSPSTCAVVDDTAKCFAAEDVCTTEGEEIITRCSTSSNKIFLSKCTTGSDGKLYYISAGSRECPNGCNAEGTDCAD